MCKISGTVRPETLKSRQRIENGLEMKKSHMRKKNEKAQIRT
jgi:hypothetical protein